VRSSPGVPSIPFIRQRDPLGLGHAVLVAEDHVAGESFAVLLGDDLIAGNTPLLQEMLRIHERYGRSVIAVVEVARDEIGMYGSIEPDFVQERLGRGGAIREEASPGGPPPR